MPETEAVSEAPSSQVINLTLLQAISLTLGFALLFFSGINAIGAFFLISDVGLNRSLALSVGALASGLICLIWGLPIKFNVKLGDPSGQQTKQAP